ncbi:MAG: polyprenyl synthetase family protein [Butyrivibrio sp.]|nr:polyprenyl synthetase family protein [Butyrivibrio sp.]
MSGYGAVEFQRELARRTEDAERVVQAHLPKDLPETRVLEAMSYSVTAGGKRLRPLLIRAVYDCCVRETGGNPDPQLVEPFMAAMEYIHTYSLVHDDLPAMDNDEYRRGKKTTHAVYGPGIATLAGDGLLNYAFELMLQHIMAQEDPERMRRFVRAAAIQGEAAGIRGMVGGQSRDLEAEGRKVDLDTLQLIHEGKTAAMLRACFGIGATLAGLDERQVEALEQVGDGIGMAFQIRDDILDVTGDAAQLGKPLHSDEKNDKATVVSLLGVEGAEAECLRYTEHALGILQSYEPEGGFLTQLARHLTTREA